MVEHRIALCLACSGGALHCALVVCYGGALHCALFSVLWQCAVVVHCIVFWWWRTGIIVFSGRDQADKPPNQTHKRTNQFKRCLPKSKCRPSPLHPKKYHSPSTPPPHAHPHPHPCHHPHSMYAPEAFKGFGFRDSGAILEVGAWMSGWVDKWISAGCRVLGAGCWLLVAEC
jgi:hypothetical protein